MNKRLYINYELNQEIPEKISKDINVYTSEIGFIIVKSEYKKKFEKKYDIPLTNFSEWFTDKYSQTHIISELIYEIVESEPLLESAQKGNVLNVNLIPTMIKSTLDKLSILPDDKIIEYILNYKLEEILKIVIKPFVMSEVMKNYQDRLRDLEKQYRSDWVKQITDV